MLSDRTPEMKRKAVAIVFYGSGKETWDSIPPVVVIIDPTATFP